MNIKSEEGIFEISNSVLRGKISNGLWGETDYRVGAGIEKHSAPFFFFPSFNKTPFRGSFTHQLLQLKLVTDVLMILS